MKRDSGRPSQASSYLTPWLDWGHLSMVKEERLFLEKKNHPMPLQCFNKMYNIQSKILRYARKEDQMIQRQIHIGNLATEVIEHGFLNKYAYHALKIDKRWRILVKDWNLQRLSNENSMNENKIRLL